MANVVLSPPNQEHLAGSRIVPLAAASQYRHFYHKLANERPRRRPQNNQKIWRHKSSRYYYFWAQKRWPIRDKFCLQCLEQAIIIIIIISLAASAGYKLARTRQSSSSGMNYGAHLVTHLQREREKTSEKSAASNQQSVSTEAGRRRVLGGCRSFEPTGPMQIERELAPTICLLGSGLESINLNS